MVTFKKFNLQDSTIPLGRFDIIFLRYVAIYFSTEFKIALFKKLFDTLNPGGFLVVGAVETLRGVSEDFELEQRNNGFFYRKPA